MLLCKTIPDLVRHEENIRLTHGVGLDMDFVGGDNDFARVLFLNKVAEKSRKKQKQFLTLSCWIPANHFSVYIFRKPALVVVKSQKLFDAHPVKGLLGWFRGQSGLL